MLSYRNNGVNILAAMVCLGLLTLTAQFVFTRELLIVCGGNELTIGVVITLWLVWTGVGAWAGRRVAELAGEGWWERRGSLLFAWLACIVPLMIVLIRITGGGMRPAAGEAMSLSRMFVFTAAVMGPVCFVAGLLFPTACAVLARRSVRRDVSAAYAAEALGSCAGGMLGAFLLAGRCTGLQMGVLASAAGFTAAGLAAGGVRRGCFAAAAVAALAVALHPDGLRGLEAGTQERRWKHMGVVRDDGPAEGRVRLVAWGDTRYQHLSLMESAGQYTLYGDGQVAYSFPDPLGYEHEIHVVMAQKPDARTVLVIGGNPAGEIPVLLSYPLRKLVRVEMDRGSDALVRKAAPALLAAGEGDPRLETRIMDGVRFVKNDTGCYDVILVRVPEPVTGGINRFYTREFYDEARRRLAPGGFLYTSLEASERLEQDAVRVAASVHKAMKAVFPEVKVTAGSPMRFYAAERTGVLTFDVRELERRWREVNPPARYFRPGYFSTMDEMAPERVEQVERRLRDAVVAENSLERPVSYFQTLILWSRYSGSGIEAVMRAMERVRVGWVCGGILLAAAVWMAVAAVRWRRGKGVGRVAPGLVMAGVGFSGVALELVLLYAYQGVEGHIYSRMGFLVGLFMSGAVAGALAGRRMEKSEELKVACGVGGGIVVLAMVAWLVWKVGGGLAAWTIPLLMACVGLMVGWQFVGVARLFRLEGLSDGGAAAATEACDYLGAASGGIMAGIVLVPVFGLRQTGLVLLTVLGACLLVVCTLSTLSDCMRKKA